MSECKHTRVAPEVCDQTLGVKCLDCNALVAVCWDTHVPESLWNRACENDPEGKPCEQNRDDVCGICDEPIDPVTLEDFDRGEPDADFDGPGHLPPTY